MLRNSKTKANQKRKEGNAMEKKKIGIIGGGISGTCLGYHLSLYDNAEVVVFEKDTIGGASTAKSAGTVCLFDDSLRNRYWDVRLYGFESYLKMEAEEKGSAGFDKTGTLTKGVFEVVGVHHNTMEEKKILEYAALAESFSSHPISRSLKTAYGKEIDQKRVTDVEEISGNGVTAKVDGISVAVGNTKLMKRIGVEAVECHQVGTVTHVAIDGAYAGHILISDVLKPTSKEAIVNLKKNGIKETVMLTGDIDKVAQQVAGELGVDRVYSELLPADKVSKVEELLAKKTEKEKLAFVGDGINDAPVLSRADIGIAMGAMGSDAAIEAADVVLMDDDPMKIVKAIRIAKKCMRIVYENIYFAIGIKILCLILGALGIANMWMAIFADVGVMIIAVLNAIRTLFVKNL